MGLVTVTLKTHIQRTVTVRLSDNHDPKMYRRSNRLDDTARVTVLGTLFTKCYSLNVITFSE